MGFRIKSGETAAAGLTRMIGEQIDKALAEVAEKKRPRHEALHQVRKRNKKVRALLRLGRAAIGTARYRAENVWFRDTSRLLSALRDESGLIEAIDRLKPIINDKALSVLMDQHRALLVSQRSSDAVVIPPLRQAVGRLRIARQQMAGWQVQDRGFDCFADGLARTYQRAQQDFALALNEPSDEALHAWRKRVKYHGFHLRVLTPLSPLMLSAWRDRLLALSATLGEDHDLAILREALLPYMRQSGSMTLAFNQMIAARRRDLQRHAYAEGKLLLSDPTASVVARLAPLWSLWVQSFPADNDRGAF